MPGRASPSTTKGRATRSGSSRSASRRSRSAAANISNSSPMAATAGRNSGCRTAGRRCSSRAGRRRSTGAARTANGASSRCPASGRSSRPSRSVMSASTRPTPSRAGPASACRPRPSGRSRRAIVPLAGNLADSGHFHPCRRCRRGDAGLRQMIGDVWEWTASPYVAYPRFRPAAGAIGEYNGKFMSQPDGVARRRGGDAGRPYPHHLPQLLPALGALGVLRAAARRGSVMDE